MRLSLLLAYVSHVAAQAGVWQEKGIPGVTTQSVFSSILTSPCVPHPHIRLLVIIDSRHAPVPRSTARSGVRAMDAANGLVTCSDVRASDVGAFQPCCTARPLRDEPPFRTIRTPAHPWCIGTTLAPGLRHLGWQRGRCTLAYADGCICRAIDPTSWAVVRHTAHAPRTAALADAKREQPMARACCGIQPPHVRATVSSD